MSMKPAVFLVALTYVSATLASNTMQAWDVSAAAGHDCASSTHCSCGNANQILTKDLGEQECKTKCLENDACYAIYCDNGVQLDPEHCNCHEYTFGDCLSTRTPDSVGDHFIKTPATDSYWNKYEEWDIFSADVTCADSGKCTCDKTGQVFTNGIGVDQCMEQCLTNTDCEVIFCDYGEESGADYDTCNCHEYVYGACKSTRTPSSEGIHFSKKTASEAPTYVAIPDDTDTDSDVVWKEYANVVCKDVDTDGVHTGQGEDSGSYYEYTLDSDQGCSLNGCKSKCLRDLDDKCYAVEFRESNCNCQMFYDSVNAYKNKEGKTCAVNTNVQTGDLVSAGAVSSSHSEFVVTGNMLALIGTVAVVLGFAAFVAGRRYARIQSDSDVDRVPLLDKNIVEL